MALHWIIEGVLRKEEEMQEKLDEIFRIANNALYFDDSSDWLQALNEICLVAKPEEAENIGKKFIERKEEE